MKRPSIRRAQKPSERSQVWGIIGGVTAALLLIIAFLGIRAIEPSGVLFWFIVFMGLIALTLMIVTAFYSARKRLLQERLRGTMMAWLKVHIYLGGAALVAAIAHSFLFSWAGGITSGKVAIILLILLVGSGVAWRIVYLKVPPQVPDDVGNLSIGDTRSRSEDLRIELEKARVGKSKEFQAAVDGLLAGRSPYELRQFVASFPDEEQPAWGRIEDLAQRLYLESQREVKQNRYSRMLQGWRAIHLPLGILLLLAVIFHLWSVFNLGRLFADEPEKQFAAAEDCASCHSDIVDEWKLSMHRNAQTSTITVAQTIPALQNNPSFEKACVNCHAPIGVRFSDEVTFPLLDDPGVNPTTADEEGITCVVCHTMEEHPDERQGFQDPEELPITERGGLSFGEMFGPPLGSDEQSNPAHDTDTGFMTDEIQSSQLCGACHNVIVDKDNNGIAPIGSEGPPINGNGDDLLDENEVDAVNDLVLQTTFDEWEDFLHIGEGGVASSCVDCHMPPLEGPAADGPPLAPAEERSRNSHTFVGVDYEMNEDYYVQPGMPDDAMAKVLEEREELLGTTVKLNVFTEDPVVDQGVMRIEVGLKNLTGHDFPTGFAFARQWWLEVSARNKTTNTDICLLDLEGFPSGCKSGVVESPTDPLKTCDLQQDAARGAGEAEELVDVQFIESFPPGECDPWLVNFQKVLTSGVNGGTAREEVFQTDAGGIVLERLRTADGTRLSPIRWKDSVRLVYEFDASQVAPTDSIDINVKLRFRHLPPYFVEGLEEFLPGELTADDLLENMTIVDVASNDPNAETETTPAPEELAARAGRERPATAAAGGSGGPWEALPLLVLLLGLPVALRRRTARRAPS